MPKKMKKLNATATENTDKMILPRKALKAVNLKQIQTISKNVIKANRTLKKGHPSVIN